MAINTTEISDIFKNIVECCICEEPFTDPRILPCFHTFCVNCLKEIGSKDSKGPGDIIPCPQCSAVFTLPLGGFMGLQKNLFMDKLLGVIDRSSQQSVCDMNTGSCSSVGWYCKECKQKLCAECSILHKTIKTQKNHHVVPFENHADSLQSFDINNSTFCDRHEKERLKLFCNDCKVVLCTFCFLENHQTHKWSKVTDAAKLFRTHITRNIDMLSSCVSETRSSNEESNIRLSATVMNVESAIKAKKLQVKAMLERIVDEDERSLLLRLTSLTQRASKQHEMKAEEIFRHQMKLDKYIMFCKEIAAQGSDVDICRAASEVENRAKELKDLLGTATDRQTTRFQITFEDNKSEDLLKTRYGNLLGQIEVSNDKLTSGNELFENSSLAAKPKLKNAIAIIDPSTGENVLETLEIESIQTSDEALKIKSEFAHKVVQTIINGGKKTTNFQSEENKAKQPLFGATRPNNFLTTAPACFAPDKQGNVEEKLMTAEENPQEKVQDRGKEKSDEKMQENILNKRQQERQEQKQERTQGSAPIIAKQLQVENDDTQKPPLDAEPLQMGQKSRELGSGQSKTKTEKTHVLIPDDSRSDKRTNTELLRPTWTISSSPSEETPPNPRRRAIIMYDREFLLQLRYMPESLKTPLWLSDCPDISLSMRASLPHRDTPSQTHHEITPRFAPQPLDTSGTSVKRDSSQKRSKGRSRRPQFTCEELSIIKTGQA